MLFGCAHCAWLSLSGSAGGYRQLMRIAADALCHWASQPISALHLMQTLLRELPWKPLDPLAIEPLAAAIRTLSVSPMLPSGEAAFAAAAHLVVRAPPRSILSIVIRVTRAV